MKKSHRTVYFEYIKRIHQVYRNRIDEEGSKSVMSALTVDYDYVNTCVKNTFDNRDDINASKDNSILRKDQ